MTEEQSFNIPLDSPIDTSSDNQLVPLQQPELLDNEQNLGAGLLANSLFHEMDGHYANWYNYQLAFIVEYNSSPSYKNNDRPSVISIDRTMVPYKYAYLKWRDGTVLKFGPGGVNNKVNVNNVVKVGDTYVITGRLTEAAYDFTFVVDMHTRLIISEDVPDGYNYSVSYSKNTWFFKIAKRPDPNDMLELMQPNTVNPYNLEWSYFDNIKTSGNHDYTFRYNAGGTGRDPYKTFIIGINDDNSRPEVPTDTQLELLGWERRAEGTADEVNILRFLNHATLTMSGDYMPAKKNYNPKSVKVQAYSESVVTAGFSANDIKMAPTPRDVNFWTTYTLRIRAVLTDTFDVSDVSFSADGTFLVTIGQVCTTSLDPDTLEDLAVWYGPYDATTPITSPHKQNNPNIRIAGSSIFSTGTNFMSWKGNSLYGKAKAFSVTGAYVFDPNGIQFEPDEMFTNLLISNIDSTYDNWEIQQQTATSFDLIELVAQPQPEPPAPPVPPIPTFRSHVEVSATGAGVVVTITGVGAGVTTYAPGQYGIIWSPGQLTFTPAKVSFNVACNVVWPDLSSNDIIEAGVGTTYTGYNGVDEVSSVGQWVVWQETMCVTNVRYDWAGRYINQVITNSSEWPTASADWPWPCTLVLGTKNTANETTDNFDIAYEYVAVGAYLGTFSAQMNRNQHPIGPIAMNPMMSPIATMTITCDQLLEIPEFKNIKKTPLTLGVDNFDVSMTIKKSEGGIGDLHWDDAHQRYEQSFRGIAVRNRKSSFYLFYVYYSADGKTHDVEVMVDPEYGGEDPTLDCEFTEFKLEAKTFSFLYADITEREWLFYRVQLLQDTGILAGVVFGNTAGSLSNTGITTQAMFQGTAAFKLVYSNTGIEVIGLPMKILLADKQQHGAAVWRIIVALDDTASCDWYNMGVAETNAGVIDANYTGSEKNFTITLVDDTGPYVLTFKNPDLRFLYTDLRTNEPFTSRTVPYEDDFLLVDALHAPSMDVANQWFVDDNTVLRLTQTTIELWKRNIDADVWGAFVMYHSVPRQNILQVKHLKYGVSNAQGGTRPFFYRISVDGDEAIQIDWAYISNDILDDLDDRLDESSFILDLMHIEGDGKMSTTALSSFEAMQAQLFISSIKVSATVIGPGTGSSYGADNTLVRLGLFIDKGLKQWTVDLVTKKILNGFGFVGPDGTVTGGYYPVVYTSVTDGFNATVTRPVGDIVTKDEALRILYIDGAVYFIAEMMREYCMAIEPDGNLVTLDMISASYVDDYLEGDSRTAGNTMNMEVDLGLVAAIAAVALSIKGLDSVSGAGTGNIDVLGTGVPFPNPISLAAALGLVAAAALLGETSFKIPLPTMATWLWGNAILVMTSDTNHIRVGPARVCIRDYRTGEYYTNPANDIMWKLIEKMMNSKTETPPEDSPNEVVSDQALQLQELSALETEYAGVGNASLEYRQKRDAVFAKYEERTGYSYHDWVAETSSSLNPTGSLQAAEAHNNFEIQVEVAAAEKEAEESRNSAASFMNSAVEDVLAVDFKVARVGASASLNLADFFSIGADSHVNAGPGYVQLQTDGLMRISGMDDFYLDWNQKIQVINPLTQIGEFAIPEELTGFKQFDVGNGRKVETNKIVGRSIGHCHRYISYPIEKGVKVAGFSGERLNYRMFSRQEFIGDGVEGLTQSAARRRLQLETKDDYANIAPVESRVGMIQGVYRRVSTMAYDEALDDQSRPYVDRTNVKNFPALDVNFGPPTYDDLLIDEDNEIYYTVYNGQVTCISCRDTKIIDGPSSNEVKTANGYNIATPYGVVSCYKPCSVNDIRLRLITEDTLIATKTGLNCVKNGKLYHAMDGNSYKIRSWVGTEGNDIERLNQIYSSFKQDMFKLYNVYPGNNIYGYFKNDPVFVQPYEVYDEYIVGNPIRINNMVPTENAMAFRYSIPFLHERLSLLPLTIQTSHAYKAYVIDGITSLTTQLRTTNHLYKAMYQKEFTIYGNGFSLGNEYITALETAAGTASYKEVVAAIGLTFLGNSTKEAVFFSRALRMLFAFSGSQNIDPAQAVSRFIECVEAVYEFTQQELIVGAVAEDYRWYNLRVKNRKVVGMVARIPEHFGDVTIDSISCGLLFQGLTRGRVMRYMPQADIMLSQMHDNAPMWKRIPGDTWDDFDKDREYNVDNNVSGWCHAPYKLQTAYMGIGDNSDCKFEWQMTFVCTPFSYELIGDKYVTVNIAAELITQGGNVISEVTHLYLFKELFSRRGKNGYYTFKWQSNNGIGMKESVRLWSDGYIAIQDGSFKCNAKIMTTNRVVELGTAQYTIDGKEQL